MNHRKQSGTINWMMVTVWGGLAALTVIIWALALIGARTLLSGGCS